MSIRQTVYFHDESDLEWLRETYPDGSLSWLCSLFLKKFRAVHSLTPTDYIEIAAKQLSEALNDKDS